jgi:hypothetical protein
MTKVDWRSLAATLNTMTEEQIEHLLRDEVAVHRRPVIAKRLHQRFSILRTARERAELMERVSK